VVVAAVAAAVDWCRYHCHRSSYTQPT